MLAVIGSDEASTGNVERARKLRRASYIVSTVGIVVAIVVIAIILGVYFGLYCKYQYDGVCFRHFSPYMSRDECYAKGGVYHHDDGCYYD